MKDIRNKEIRDDSGKVIRTREYSYTRADGKKFIIQDHSAGHKFGAPDNKGDQGAHLNLRPHSNIRTGKVTGAKEHYEFKAQKNEHVE